MNRISLSFPELGFVVVTRAILGVGIGLLLAGRLGDRRKSVGAGAGDCRGPDDDSGVDRDSRIGPPSIPLPGRLKLTSSGASAIVSSR